ncbi:hypothetical protein Arub01_35210 [Actinomadura rubrobrunea]|uniref:Uncharacterized protein n=1 Tax=Actinomadura rubrobrunea TaxID=115335 RepID=A0A9W6PYY9_9ACTN|nr:hypothetical protein [Actinomadura rubrobrunea]GLW65277.1 hypothetical protein Arub01_35210 [Actinomadura rubrobrunea]
MGDVDGRSLEESKAFGDEVQGKSVAERYPQYYFYERWPVVFVRTPEGGLECLALSPKTGGFERDMSYYRKILFGTTADIDTVTRDEFIQRVEALRRKRLKGEGPVFALYETIKAMQQKILGAGRRITPEEKALIHALQVRTHKLFEAELRAQGLRGMPEES